MDGRLRHRKRCVEGPGAKLKGAQLSRSRARARCCGWLAAALIGLLGTLHGACAQAVGQLPHAQSRRGRHQRANGTSRCATSISRSGSMPMATARSPGAKCAPSMPTSRPTRWRAWPCSGDGAACPSSAGEQLIDNHTDGAYTVLPLRVGCPQLAGATRADLHALRRPRSAAPRPAQPRVARRRAHGGARTARADADLRPEGDQPARAVLDYGREGVWHIWIGFDHILFLLSLLLPAVLVWQQPALARRRVASARRSGTSSRSSPRSPWRTRSRCRSRRCGVVELPSRWVESAIAASVRAGRAEQRLSGGARPPLGGGVRLRADPRLRLRQRAGRPRAAAATRWCWRWWASTSASNAASWRSSRCSCRWPSACGARGCIRS